MAAAYHLFHVSGTPKKLMQAAATPSQPEPGHYNQLVDERADDSQAPDTHLAVYGSLAPGRVDHYQIASLGGHWRRGTVKGKLFPSGWGAALGFPGLILDPAGPAIDVDLFESTDLTDHLVHLDDCEGSGYRRVVTTVDTAQGERSAWIYVLGRRSLSTIINDSIS